MQFQIQRKYSYFWDDTRWTEEVGGENKPLLVERARDAQVALNEIFDTKKAISLGNLTIAELSRDHRIVLEIRC